MPPSRDLACVSLRDDGSGDGSVEGRVRADPVARAAHPLRVEPHWRLDSAGGSDEPGLLGEAPPRHGPFCRRPADLDGRRAPRAAGTWAGGDVVRAGASDG